MKMKNLKVIPIVALGVLSIASCSKSDSSITITIWEDESNIETVKTLTDEYLAHYKQQYPNGKTIKIVFEEQMEKSAIEKMATVAASGNGPDIAAITHDTIAAGVSDHLIAPVAFDDAIKARMTSDAVNAVTYNDQVYAYPITAESMTVMYDKSKITESELSSLENLKSSGKKIAWTLSGDNAGYYTSGLYSDSIIFGEDGKDSTSLNLATTKAVENVYSFFHDYVSCFEDATPEKGAAYVSNGTVCGIVTSPFMLSDMKNALGNNLGVATLPTINGNSLKSFSGYKCYAVSTYSEHGQIAQDIANYLTSYDSMNWRLFKKGYLPACALDATSEIAENIAENVYASSFAQSLSNSRVMPNIPKMQDFWQPMNNATKYFVDNASTLTTEVVKTQLETASSTIINK